MRVVLRLCFVVVRAGRVSIHSGDMGHLGDTDIDRPAVLLDAVSRAYVVWFEGRLVDVARSAGRPLSPEARDRARGLARSVSDEVLAELAQLLATDVDAQRENPLHVLRRAALNAAEFLSAEGVPAPARDEFEERAMPDDTYGIGPLAWRDLGERVHDAGIEWGAWKAATVLTRRREEGLR